MKHNFQFSQLVIPICLVLFDSVNSAKSRSDEQVQNITLGKEVFTC